MSQELKELRQEIATKETELIKERPKEKGCLGNAINKNPKKIQSEDELNALHNSLKIMTELRELRKKRSFLEAEQRKQH